MLLTNNSGKNVSEELLAIYLTISVFLGILEMVDDLKVTQSPCVPRLVPFRVQLSGIVVALHHILH